MNENNIKWRYDLAIPATETTPAKTINFNIEMVISGNVDETVLTNVKNAVNGHCNLEYMKNSWDIESIDKEFSPADIKKILISYSMSFKQKIPFEIKSVKIAKILVNGEEPSSEPAPIPATKTNSTAPAAQKPVTKVVNTNEGAKDGQIKCPKCGATEISPSKESGKLVCNFCRTVFEPEKAEGFNTDIANLSGTVIGSGAQNIEADAKSIITLKCQSCGAEVVIDASEKTQARCHWCRNMLSLENAVPNGAVPDIVLPFGITKEVAKAEIEKFVNKRKFFANPTFKKEFTTENIMGVYFPYMIVDANIHSKLVGTAEIERRRYTVKEGDHYNTYYDADCYNVSREYDLAIEGLSIESSKDRLNNASSEKTNNIINSIMPFDTENAVKWNANYLKGCTSEKRDTNIDDLQGLVQTQVKDISRFAANDTIKEYNRGAAWTQENLDMKGSQWKSAYLPVWLYSYRQVKGNKELLHYVAVNARTKETMGSVPINMTRLWILSIIFEIIGFFIMLAISEDWSYVFLLCGPIFFFIFYARYRNSGARHTYETETKHTMSNLVKGDSLLEHRKRLSSSKIRGCNNTSVNGSTNSTKFIDKINGKEISKSLVDSLTNGNAVSDYINQNIDKKDKK